MGETLDGEPGSEGVQTLRSAPTRGTYLVITSSEEEEFGASSPFDA